MMFDPFFSYLTKNRKTLSQEVFKERSRYKTYTRFSKCALPLPGQINSALSDLLVQRRSRREYGEKGVTLQELSTILFWSAGILDGRESATERRAHPSGGAKFPVETYVVNFGVKDGDLKKGTYHYNVRTHELEELPFVDHESIRLAIPSYNEFALQGQFLLLFSFNKHRSYQKYGALAYKLAFIEAGHIGQNVYLTAEALGLACCGMGTSDPTDFDNPLELHAHEETVFYVIVLGTRKEEKV